jgi:hypothetical protein
MMQTTRIPTNSLSVINNKQGYKKEPSLQDKQACWLEWQRSGMNKTDFCRQRRMSTATFYRWIKELGQITSATARPALVPVTVTAIPSSDDNSAGAFPPSYENAVDIWLPNGIHLRASIGNALTALTPFIQEISHVGLTNTIS